VGECIEDHFAGGGSGELGVDVKVGDELHWRKH